MKKLFIILSFALILSGCKDDGVPVKIKFPEAIKELMEACPDLTTMDEKSDKLSDLLYAVTDNYGTYYECKVKVDAWINWYNSQKENYDQIWK